VQTLCLSFHSTEELLLARHADPASTVLIADLTVDGQDVSNNRLYFAAPKDLQLSPPTITATLTPNGQKYLLRLSSRSLASGAYISFGDLDVKLSDNYFDLLPGHPYSVEISSPATAAQLNEKLRVISLSDAATVGTEH